jgi:hypothetical protein
MNLILFVNKYYVVTQLHSTINYLFKLLMPDFTIPDGSSSLQHRPKAEVIMEFGFERTNFSMLGPYPGL